jgi:hypothetical protein
LIQNAPTHFGTRGNEIFSEADQGRISATVEMPTRNAPKSVLLRLGHPKALPMKGVTVNGNPWMDFDAEQEIVRLHDVEGRVEVMAEF